MKIKYEYWGKTHEKDLQQLILDANYEHGAGIIENLERGLENLAAFNIRTLELLYKKNLIAKEDIRDLVADLDYILADDLKVEIDIEV